MNKGYQSAGSHGIKERSINIAQITVTVCMHYPSFNTRTIGNLILSFAEHVKDQHGRGQNGAVRPNNGGQSATEMKMEEVSV